MLYQLQGRPPGTEAAADRHITLHICSGFMLLISTISYQMPVFHE